MDSTASPARRQYLAIKKQYPEAILFFRMGDFYEMFDEDARIVSRELELTLTSRDSGKAARIPMAGFPFHQADTYLARLLAKGFKVAVCDQVSDPATSKGIVEREVTRVVTPGTVVDPALLADKRNNFLAAAVLGKKAVGIAYADITTGEFATTQITSEEPELTLQQEIARLAPAECLYEQHARPTGEGRFWSKRSGTAAESQALDSEMAGSINPSSGSVGTLLAGSGPHLTPFDARYFREDTSRECLQQHFEVSSLDGYGCGRLPLAIRAAGAVLTYLQQTQKGMVSQLTHLETYSTANFMTLDPHTRRNLDLFESGRSGSVKGSLLWVLDETKTPMGGRLLRRWLNQPLLDLTALQQRQEVIGEALENLVLRHKLILALAKCGDLERLINRVLQRIATPRDLAGLKNSLQSLQVLALLLSGQDGSAIDSLHVIAEPLLTGYGKQWNEDHSGNGSTAGLEEGDSTKLAGSKRGSGFLAESPQSGHEFPKQPLTGTPQLAVLLNQVDPCPECVALIERALLPDPPLSPVEGGVICPSYNAELDELTALSKNARQWVAELERSERERTGIRSLKVGYTKVFGYYLEVTTANLGQVPADYIRKQTLVGAERFITPDLKEYENRILNAQERIGQLESELFAQVRAEVGAYAQRLLQTARTVAELDVLLGLAEVAERRNYVRPTLTSDDTLHIVAGRHPVVELALGGEPFVPNDAQLDTREAQIVIITGPNMAGKSTYLRQVALITLLAQIGSYVPAEAATIGLVDRIFTRIGAQDDLATGQSTFMVEMVETAAILHHATPRSLIILDEIGRGTSTYDGLAIARAIVEYIHNHPRCAAKTLFATHYHELVEASKALPRVLCSNVAVTEEEGQVVFLRKIVPGGADRSYGIHVAQLAGLPRTVIHRASEILADLEHGMVEEKKRRRSAGTGVPKEPPPAIQLTLFTPEPPLVVGELLKLKVEELTPLEAISKLYELQQRAREGN